MRALTLRLEVFVAEQARVRISLSAGDLEVEGTEDFVKQYADSIRTLINRLEELPNRQVVPPTEAPGGPAPAAAAAPAAEQREFGEVLHSLPSNASGSDRILVAGWYAQLASGDNTFSTGEANQLLLGQGVKLSNPSQALKNAIAAKRVFKVGKRYRVSKTGEEHLKSLIS
jgi:hypothetical protein